MANVLEGAQINERFVTECGQIVTFIGERDDNGEFRYTMRDAEGRRRYYNVHGRSPLNYDPGMYIRQKQGQSQHVYAERPVFP